MSDSDVTEDDAHRQADKMDSLALLIPNLASSDPSPPTKTSPTTAHMLEQVTARMIEHIARHDFAHPDFEEWMDPSYTASEYADCPYATSRDEYLRTFKAFTDRHPDYSIELISITADVNYERGTAVVWMYLRVKGHPTTLWRESVTTGYWRRKHTKWIYYRQTGIRGISWQ